MKPFRRTPKPVAPAAVAQGLRAYADDRLERLAELRAALEEAGVVTDPGAMTDADIARITALAHQAHAELIAARIPH